MYVYVYVHLYVFIYSRQSSYPHCGGLCGRLDHCTRHEGGGNRGKQRQGDATCSPLAPLRLLLLLLCLLLLRREPVKNLPRGLDLDLMQSAFANCWQTS